jgi:hypothetical protein
VNARQLRAEIEASVGCGRWFVWPETGLSATRTHTPRSTLLVHGTLERRPLAMRDPRRSGVALRYEYRLSGRPREESEA